jgi:hypothetical protein
MKSQRKMACSRAQSVQCGKAFKREAAAVRKTEKADRSGMQMYHIRLHFVASAQRTGCSSCAAIPTSLRKGCSSYPSLWRQGQRREVVLLAGHSDDLIIQAMAKKRGSSSAAVCGTRLANRTLCFHASETCLVQHR